MIMKFKKIKSDLEEFNRQKNFDKNFDQFHKYIE